jgi:GT2 family glycosyltransferase
LLSADDDIELIVVDQSEGDATDESLHEFRRDPRFRYLHLDRPGKGNALNVGVRAAHGQFIVCTDDDCDVPPHWVMDMARTLQEHPEAAILFCNVVAVPHDPTAGYVPAYERTTDRVLRSIEDARNGMGLGAGMAFRRDVALELGGFDESFGPGGRFPSADEWDLALRALLSGWHVYETSKLAIVHDGFRTFAEGRAHAERDWIALGAVCAKPLRAGRLSAVIVPLWFFPTRALLPPILDVMNLRRPRGLIRITGFVRGFVQGLGTSVDRRTLRFVPKS